MILYWLDMTTALADVGSAIIGRVRSTSLKVHIKLRTDNCLYCGKQLSVLHRFRNLLYCNSSHRSAHSHELTNLALGRAGARRGAEIGSLRSAGMLES